MTLVDKTAAARRTTAPKNAAVTTVGGVRTRIIECPGAAPTVLLLHGFSDSADGWRAVIERLARAGHRAVALDLPYFGRAGRPTSQAVLPVLDDFVAAALRQYDTGHGVVLVGNSLGGLAALRAAQRPGLPVSAAVAIGPAGLCIPRWMKLVGRTRQLTDRLLHLSVPPVIRGTVSGPALISAGFAAAVASGRIPPAARAQYASHWGPGDLRRQLLLGGQTITELIGAVLLDSTPFAVPVTLVWGTRDWISPPRAVKAIKKAHPQVAVRLIRGSGHCPQYDQPDMVTEIIAGTIAATRQRCTAAPTRQERSS
jgi:pimeloyl-ACP methyl ester carboxylesterase